MIRSMTGYGRGESSGKFGTIKVDIKTLNHRFFDMSSRLPEGLAIFEDKIREYVQRKVKRGRVNLSISYHDGVVRTEKLVLDKRLAVSLLKEIRKFKNDQKLKGEIELNQIITFPGVLTYSGSTANMGRLWKNLKEALDEALEHLDESRAREGRSLSEDMLSRIHKIEKNIIAIEKRAHTSTRHYKKALYKKVKELSGGVEIDKGRLEQEVALYARGCDVTEEITRFKSHVISFDKFLNSGGEKGKTLDFVAQELMREVNTIGAKSSDFQISSRVIKIKSEIEKVREQVKNIE
jgi:uncharacterized protein (TIGR00255 family)